MAKNIDPYECVYISLFTRAFRLEMESNGNPSEYSRRADGLNTRINPHNPNPELQNLLNE